MYLLAFSLLRLESVPKGTSRYRRYTCHLSTLRKITEPHTLAFYEQCQDEDDPPKDVDQSTLTHQGDEVGHRFNLRLRFGDAGLEFRTAGLVVN